MNEALRLILLFVPLVAGAIAIFFMSLYIEQYHSNTSTLQVGFDVLLSSFSAKYEISKRERDVVQLTNLIRTK